MERPGLPVNDPERLSVLAATGLLDNSHSLIFDRFTRLACKIFETPIPVSLVSLVTQDRQFFLSHIGLVQDQTPISHSFCQHIVNTARPLIVKDARVDPRVCTNPAIQDLNVIAYLGVPLVVRQQTLGSLCVIDTKPRDWTDRDISILRDLAAAVVAEIELRLTSQALQHSHRQVEEQITHRTQELERVIKFQEQLQVITTEVRSSLDERSILKTVVQQLGQSLKASRCEVGVYTADQTVSIIGYEDDTNAIVSERTNVTQLFPSDMQTQLTSGHFIQACIPRYLSPQHLSYRSHQDKAVAEVVICPIQEDSELIGELWVTRSPAHSFAEDEVSLIQQVANQCAAALHQARLYQNLQDQLQQLKKLNEHKNNSMLSSVQDLDRF